MNAHCSGFGKTDHQLRVEQFMVLAKQRVPNEPHIPEGFIRNLRARLILEEALETINALGFAVCCKQCGGDITPKEMPELSDSLDYSIADVIDGCCDLSVVTTGALSAFGIPDDVFLREVDINNMMKFSGDAHLDENGKWIKPTGHKPPKIKELLQIIAEVKRRK